MFNKKLLSVIAYVLGLLLLVKLLFVVTMFVWSYFGVPPIQVFQDPMGRMAHVPPNVVTYILLAQEVGATAFIYLILGVLAKMASHAGMKGKMDAAHCVPVTVAAEKPAKRAGRPRKRARAKTTKKK